MLDAANAGLLANTTNSITVASAATNFFIVPIAPQNDKLRRFLFIALLFIIRISILQVKQAPTQYGMSYDYNLRAFFSLQARQESLLLTRQHAK